MNTVDFKRFALLSDLTEEDLQAIAELLEERRASGGVPLFREGSEAEGLVLITQGKVRLTSRRSDEEMILGPGESLAGVSLFAVGAHESTAIAEGACKYLLLPRTSFLRLADDAPRTACRLAGVLLTDMAELVREGLDLMAAQTAASPAPGES